MIKRVGHIDVAKGLAILLVVWGHSWSVLKGYPELFRVIYSFHVPAFFLLSGVFFQPRQSWRNMIVNRADGLLKPYFFSLLPFGLLGAVVTKAGLLLAFVAILYGSGGAILNQPQWFLTCLFCVFVLAQLLVLALRFDRWSLPFQLLLLAVMLVASVEGMRYLWAQPLSFPVQFLDADKLELVRPTLPWGWPWGLDIAPLALSFFLLGYVLRKYILEAVPLWVLLLAIAAFAGMHVAFDFSMDLNLRRYDHLLWSSLEALVGIGLLLGCATVLARHAGISRVLTYFGKNTLLILLFHVILHGIFFTAGKALAPNHPLLCDVVALGLVLLALVGVIRLVHSTRWLAAVLLPRRMPARTGGVLTSASV